MHAAAFGASAGSDFTKTSPKATADPNLVLAEESSAAVPMIRLEGRYELSLGALFATAGLFGDVSLADTQYDVIDASGQHHVAAPWGIRPGGALTLGIRIGL
jgi:hypothetical protein